jgi:hypothetical protein
MDHVAEEISFSGARSAQPVVEWSTTRFEAIRPTQHPSSAVRDPSNVKFLALSPGIHCVCSPTSNTRNTQWSLQAAPYYHPEPLGNSSL